MRRKRGLVIFLLCLMLIACCVLIVVAVDLSSEKKQISKISEQESFSTDRLETKETLDNSGRNPKIIIEEQTQEIEKTETKTEAKTEEKTSWNSVETAEKTMEESTTEAKEAKQKRLILMGDSRTVAIYNSLMGIGDMFQPISGGGNVGLYGNTVFVAKGQEGYYWLNEVGISLAEPYISEDSVIVLWFGVNDPGFTTEYLQCLRERVCSYGVPVFVMSVGPCDGAQFYKNQEIIRFNGMISTGLPDYVGWIDIYTFLETGLNTGEISTVDGIHYNPASSQIIYAKLQEALGITDPVVSQ